MRVIAVANQKGGCGKTTTSINLSFSLASKNQQVLLIDFDPQAHATMGLGINPSELEKSIYEVVKPGMDSPPGIDDIVIPIRDNFDLAPSKATLSALEQELSGVDGREGRLHGAVESLQKVYDVVIIDCPPSIGHLCFNALRACEEVIIPIDLSLFSLRGVSKLTEIVILLKEKLGHEVKARALITMYDFRTRYSRQVLEKVREKFGDNVFETSIRYNIRLRETVDYGLPIGEYDKHSIGHKDYEKLAQEIMNSWVARTPQSFDALDTARNLLELSDEYASASQEPADGDQSTEEAEEAQGAVA
jgi:chromosome partitioning protein